MVPNDMNLQVKELLQALHRICRILYGMPDRSRVRVDLMVIATLQRCIVLELSSRATQSS